ncbi:D-2-hydroxyacid dehydrogenase [Evansella halocellulosilytica]|uniref:D-2-hydroxyacid dehydrogenase n=1 Tax=Evansella halocellulosilytica TaxID=2011013 RepID=UPI0027B8CEE6|nr:D-2-hydroxyacid dehydrogenase [Evansella halocellulosilytica]
MINIKADKIVRDQVRDNFVNKQEIGGVTLIVLSSAKIRRDLRENLLNKFPEVTFIFRDKMNEAEEELPHADILITYGEDLTQAHIERAAKLKWIMVISAGIDRMPFQAIKEKNIFVTNARGIHKTPMAEYAISMMLQVARKAKAIISNEQNQVWERKIEMSELSGKTIGVLGAGAIGQEIARLSKAFQMKTIGLNRSGKQVENFDEIFSYDQMRTILERADFVVSVLPKTKETNNLLGLEEFKRMKNDAILINIGRGNVINDADLISALNEGELAHAVLDVFNEEPLVKEHPYWEMEQVTVTPHISGISPQYQPRALNIFEENLKVFLAKKENYINVIDLERGY